MKPINKILLMVLLAVFSTSLFACEPGSNKIKNSESVSLPEYFYKRLEGKINGRWNIVMNLTRNDSLLTGSYYYDDKGEPILFTYDSRIKPDGAIKIGERTGQYDKNYNEVVSGEFNGRFITNNKIEGEWLKPGTGIKYKFELHEKYPDGSEKFVMKRTSREYGNIESGGASIEYIFPQADKNNSSGSDSINNSIIHNLIAGYQFGDQKENWKSFDDEMNDFLNRFKDFEKEPVFPKEYKPYWANSFFTSVVFNSNNIVVLENVDYRFEGGAHPNTYFTFYNYELKSGKIITLSEIFKDGYKNELDKIGEQKFREKYNIKPDQDLEKAGYFLTDHKFQLNDNFAIYKGGLLFKFNPYEIAAYVFGAPEVYIPYSDIKKLLQEKSVISEYIR